MARGINNIDFDVIVHDSCVFGEDRNAALTLQITGVHDALGYGFVAAENAALAQKLGVGDCFVLPGIRTAVEQDAAGITGWLVSAAGAVEAVELRLGDLTADERQIILDGCLINFYNHN